MKIADALKTYHESDYYPFHMPGHKQQSFGDWMKVEYDITEIDGFDTYISQQGNSSGKTAGGRLHLWCKKSFFFSEWKYLRYFSIALGGTEYG